MKLVEILAKELGKWPVKSNELITQSAVDSELYYGKIRAVNKPFFPILSLSDRHTEYEEYPEVTKEMWEAEKTKQNSLSSVASDDELWGDVKEMYNKEKEVFSPIYYRDRIKEIDALVESLEEERVSLVQALEDEGFALIEKINKQLEDCKQSHEDMSDWRNWKVGDHLEIVSNFWKNGFNIGEVVRIEALGTKGAGMRLCHQGGRDFWFVDDDEVKWHSRPQKED